eukprot:scaffold651992_cov47-Prasinocladus_malaysianus.AAC.1
MHAADIQIRAGASLRDASRSISNPSSGGMSGFTAASTMIGSTQQRWMDYDSAKAAELALRT